MSILRRQPAGTPAGGQFTTAARPEARVTLGDQPHSALEVAELQRRIAHAELGQAEADLILAARRTGFMARIRPKITQAASDLARAQRAAGEADRAVKDLGGARAPALDGVRIAALRERLGDLPTPEEARSELQAVSAVVARLAADEDAHGYYDHYDIPPVAYRLADARARQTAARLVSDLVSAEPSSGRGSRTSTR